MGLNAEGSGCGGRGDAEEGFFGGDGFGGGREDAEFVAAQISIVSRKQELAICELTFMGKICVPAMMTLEADILRPGDSVRDPDLPHIMWFCGREIPFYQVLEFAGEDLAIGVACYAGGRRRRQGEDDGSCNVGWRFRGHPAVIVVCG